MKRSLLKLLFAVVTLGVLVSCSKVEGDAYVVLPISLRITQRIPSM